MQGDNTDINWDGLVLAGGRSTRMGRDKATLELDGETLLQRQVRLLQDAGARHVWISLAAGQRAPVPEGQVTCLRDQSLDRGPIEGLQQALAHSTAPKLLVVAVDLPCLTAAFLQHLARAHPAGTGTCPTSGSGLEPLCATYPTGHARRAMASWAPGSEHAPRRLVTKGLRQGWMQALPLAPGELHLLRNWNRPEDLPGS